MLGVADEWLFSGSDDGSAAIWDRESRLLLAFHRDQPSGVRDLLWDGERLLTLGRDGRVVVRALTGEPETLDLPAVSAFAAHGTRLLVATEGQLLLLGADRTVALPCAESIGVVAVDEHAVYGAGAAALYRWCEKGECTSVPIPDIADISLHGEEIIVATGHHVRVLTASSLEHRRSYYGHDRPVVSVAVDASGIWSASADRRVRHWALAESQSREPMRHRGPIRAVCARGDTIYSGGRDSSLYTWSLRRGARVDVAQIADASLEALCLSGDTLVAGFSDGTLAIRDTRAPTRGATLRCPSPVTAVCFLAEVVVVGSADGFVRTFATDGRSLVGWHAHEKRVRHLDARDGVLAVASYDHTVSLWRDDCCVGRIADHRAAVTRVALGGNGVLATGSMDETVRIYRADGELALSLADHVGGVTALIWAPNGLITAEKGGRIREWSSDGEVRHAHRVPGSVTCLARSGEHLVAGDDAGNLWILAENSPSHASSVGPGSPSHA